MKATKRENAARKAVQTRQKNADKKKKVRHEAAKKAWRTRRAKGGSGSVEAHRALINATFDFIDLCGGPAEAIKVLEQVTDQLTTRRKPR